MDHGPCPVIANDTARAHLLLPGSLLIHERQRVILLSLIVPRDRCPAIVQLSLAEGRRIDYGAPGTTERRQTGMLPTWGAGVLGSRSTYYYAFITILRFAG